MTYCFQFDVVYFRMVYRKKPPAMSWLITCYAITQYASHVKVRGTLSKMDVPTQKSNNRALFVTTCNQSVPNFNNTINTIILFLRPLTTAKTPLKIYFFLPTAALATFAIPLYVLNLNTLKTSHSSPPKITRCNDGCFSDNLIYTINCKRWLKKDITLSSQHIGQTGRTLRERFGKHRRGIQNNTDESVPNHYTLN